MKFFLVDVKSITPSKPVEQFDKAEVEKLADSILECNGLIKPLVLKPAGPESYVVVQGDMEFHAAVRAREKDPRKGEMVNALVISPKAEETVLEQIQKLQGAATPSPEYLIKHKDSSVQKDAEPISRKEDISSSQVLQEVQKEVKSINRKIEDLTSSLPSQLILQQLLERDFNESLNLLNQKLDKQEVKLQEILEYVKPLQPEDFLDFLNNKEKSELVRVKIGIGEKKAETIISNRPYNSLDDLNKVKGFGQKTTEKWLIAFSQKNL